MGQELGSGLFGQFDAGVFQGLLSDIVGVGEAFRG